LPDNVQVLDGGTLGMELLRFIDGADRLLIVDAVDGDGLPGKFYRFTNDEVKKYFKKKVSMHELGVQDVLTALELLEKPVSEVVILGVQPAVIDVGLELSPVVQSAMQPAIARTVEVLDSWGINCLQHS
jgi:hydrogenase maturation protease